MMSNRNEASDHSKRFDELTGFGESLLVCRQCGSRLTYPASCREACAHPPERDTSRSSGYPYLCVVRLTGWSRAAGAETV
jgi:hypothetical protein